MHGSVTNTFHAVDFRTILNPGAGGFDTIVHRTADVTINGVGATATVPLEMRYLSLRNTNGIIINGVNVDVYVGVSPADGGTNH